jgi:hypothetical protein
MSFTPLLDNVIKPWCNIVCYSINIGGGGIIGSGNITVESSFPQITIQNNSSPPNVNRATLLLQDSTGGAVTLQNSAGDAILEDFTVGGTIRIQNAAATNGSVAVASNGTGAITLTTNNLTIPTGAVNGYFLTTTGAGVATWNLLQQSTSYADTMGGIWGAPTPVNVNLYQNGSSCYFTVTAPGSLSPMANTASIITFSAAIPLAYRPKDSTFAPYIIADDGKTEIGILSVTSTGTVTVFPVGGANFSGSGFSGIVIQTATWELQLPAP